MRNSELSGRAAWYEVRSRRRGGYYPPAPDFVPCPMPTPKGLGLRPSHCSALRVDAGLRRKGRSRTARSVGFCVRFAGAS